MPRYKGVYSFANDFPGPDRVSAPEVGEGACSGEHRPGGQAGCCPSFFDLTLAEGDDALRREVIALWRDELQRFGPEMAWLQLFENRGAMMGCSNPHPHGQLWASDFMPSLVAQELRSQRAHYDGQGWRCSQWCAIKKLRPQMRARHRGWVSRCRSGLPTSLRGVGAGHDLARDVALTEDEQVDLARHRSAPQGL